MNSAATRSPGRVVAVFRRGSRTTFTDTSYPAFGWPRIGVGCAITRLRAVRCGGVECQTGGRAQMTLTASTDCPHPRNVDDAQLGTRASQTACCAVLLRLRGRGSTLRAGGACAELVAASGNRHHRSRRSLRQDHSRPRPAGPDIIASLFGGSFHATPTRPRAGTLWCAMLVPPHQGCAQAAVLDASPRGRRSGILRT